MSYELHGVGEEAQVAPMQRFFLTIKPAEVAPVGKKWVPRQVLIESNAGRPKKGDFFLIGETRYVVMSWGKVPEDETRAADHVIRLKEAE